MADRLNGRDDRVDADGRDGLELATPPAATSLRARLMHLPGAPAARVSSADGVEGEATGDVAPAHLVLEPGSGGAIFVDGAEEPATLQWHTPPRARFATADGARDVLVLPIPDPRRAADGIARLEVIVDGWRFEVEIEPEARARLRERATSSRADPTRGGPVELRAII